MRMFAADLRGTGQLRPELSDDFIADVVWATAGAPHYTQLVGGRGWTPEAYGSYVQDLWTRTFLTDPSGIAKAGQETRP